MPVKPKKNRSWYRYCCPVCEHGVIVRGMQIVKCTTCGKGIVGVKEEGIRK